MKFPRIFCIFSFLLFALCKPSLAIEIDAKTIIRKNEKNPKTFLGLSVRDTGVGMDPEVSSRLFEGFMQGDDSRTRKHNGTGR